MALDVVAHGALWRLDQAVAARVASWPDTTHRLWRQIVSAPGHWWMRILAVVAMAAWITRRAGWRAGLRDGAWLGAAVIATEVLVQALKALFGRLRPDGGEGAFPSGHAAAAVVTYALAAYLLARHHPRARLMPAAVALAALVGVARVPGNVHYVTDVLAGWALGAAVVTAGRPPYPVPGARRHVRVIGVTGMPGSGKSEAMDVARARGLPVVRMGDMVWEEVERQGLPRDHAHVGRIANAMREREGPDVWARRTIARVQAAHAGEPVVVIDGIRNGEEVERFRAELGDDFVLVAIHTDPDERFARMVRRGRSDDSADLAVLRERDRREMGWGIARTIALADEMVVNDGSLDDFRAQVGALLDRVA